MVVADQEERRDRRQLPEAVQDDQVVGDDEPEGTQDYRARVARALAAV